MNRDVNRRTYSVPRPSGCHSGPAAGQGARPLLLAALLVLLLTGPAGVLAATEVGTEDRLREAEAALLERDLPGAARAFAAAAMASPDPAVAERATQFTFGVGFDAFAEQTAQRWAELAPGNPLPRELLGRLKLRRRAVDDAVVDLIAALGPTQPRHDETYIALVSDLAAEDNARLVTRVASRLTALDPLSPGLQLALGTAALRSGDYALALGAGAAAAHDDPEWPEPRLLMARALAANGRSAEALEIVSTLAAANQNPMLDLEYARLLADDGRVAEARAKLTGLAGRFGDRPEINRTLAFLDLSEGHLDKAEQRLAALDGAGADRFESFYYQAQIAARRGDAEGARRFYGRISSGPYLVPAQLAIAGSLVRADATEQAVEHLQQFAEDHPAQAYDMLEYRAQLLQLLNRPDEALAVYGQALEYKPTALSVLLARGALLEQQGRVDAALADLQTAANLAPDDSTALNALGYILANRTRHSRAAWHYVRRAWELQPQSAAIEDSVGWTLFKLGRTEEARSHLEEALARLPDPELASHLAEVFWKLGARDEARDLLRSAAVAYPDSRPVRDTADRLLN